MMNCIIQIHVIYDTFSVKGANETEHNYGAALVETDPNAELHYLWIKWNWGEPKVESVVSVTRNYFEMQLSNWRLHFVMPYDGVVIVTLSTFDLHFLRLCH